jgi:hypothetical protein
MIKRATKNQFFRVKCGSKGNTEIIHHSFLDECLIQKIGRFLVSLKNKLCPMDKRIQPFLDYISKTFRTIYGSC